jgi:hypothetical protein
MSETAPAADETDWSGGDRLRIYAVYGPTTRDYPGRYVVRPFRIEPGRRDPVLEGLIVNAGSLEEARQLLHERCPWANYRLPHQPGEDPVILESWF